MQSADSFFSVSAQTFSTVGYGSTYPALGFQNDSPTNCFFVNFICSLEALIGVIYASFCGGKNTEPQNACTHACACKCFHTLHQPPV